MRPGPSGPTPYRTCKNLYCITSRQGGGLRPTLTLACPTVFGRREGEGGGEKKKEREEKEERKGRKRAVREERRERKEEKKRG